jgi:HK97 family phage prohead protease
MEVKTLLEIRTAKINMQGDKIGGYASVYDAPSHPLTVRGINGGKPFTEKVARGAFDNSLRSNISLLVGHDSRDLLANTKSGLLQLNSDAHGLAFEVTLPDTQRAKDIRALVDANVLSEMSFGFNVISDSWSGSTRTLTQVRLLEVSIVENGAYPQTSAEARNIQSGLARLRLRLRMPL